MPRYSDIDFNFIPHPVTGDLSRKTEEAAVKQAVRNLVMMNTGAKPFHPEIASNIRAMLFENATPLVLAGLKRNIITLLEAFEPRVKIEKIDIFDDALDYNAIQMELWFSIIPHENPVKINIIVNRVR
jgi:phage baseplate assembly protein W